MELKYITPITEKVRNYANEMNSRYKQIEDEIDKDRNKLSQLSNPPININGSFDIWQEGTVFESTGTYQYTADMWIMNNVPKVERIVNTCPESISPYAVKLTLGNNTYNGSFTPLENYSDLIGHAVTISFWIKANKQKDIRIFCGDNNEVFNIEAKWQKIIWITTPNATVIGERKGLQIVTTTTGHLGDTLEISDVKIELGETATPFYYKTVAQTLLECQRYFQEYKISQIPIVLKGLQDIFFTLRAITEMRIIPSIIIKGQLSLLKADINVFIEIIDQVYVIGDSSDNQGVLIRTTIVATTTMPLYIYKNIAQKIYLDARIYP